MVRAANQQQQPETSAMSPPEKQVASMIRAERAQWIRTAAVVIGVAGVFITIGRRDQDLDTLKAIVSGLVERERLAASRQSSMEADISSIKDILREIRNKQ